MTSAKNFFQTKKGANFYDKTDSKKFFELWIVEEGGKGGQMQSASIALSRYAMCPLNYIKLEFTAALHKS